MNDLPVPLLSHDQPPRFSYGLSSNASPSLIQRLQTLILSCFSSLKMAIYSLPSLATRQIVLLRQGTTNLEKPRTFEDEKKKIADSLALTTEEEKKMLGLVVLSSYLRKGNRRDNSSGINDALPTVKSCHYITESLQEFQKGTQDTPSVPDNTSLLTQLQKAEELALSSAAMKGKENNSGDYAQEIHNHISGLKTGESCLIPSGWTSTQEGAIANQQRLSGHAILLRITKEHDGTFSLICYNSGLGVDMYHERIDNKFYPYVIRNIDPKKLTKEFCKGLAQLKCASPLSSEKRAEQYYNHLKTLETPHPIVREIINAHASDITHELLKADKQWPTLSAILQNPQKRAAIIELLRTPSPQGLQLRNCWKSLPEPLARDAAILSAYNSEYDRFYQPYHEQGDVGNCSYKCLSIWLSRAMPNYQQFKRFNIQNLLAKVSSCGKWDISSLIRSIY